MRQLPTSTSVLIAGGGPVGLAAAVELGTRGVECVVLEPRETVSSLRPRAKTSHVRTMEHFRRWGLADRIRAAAHLPVEWSQSAVVCTGLLGEEITRFHDCFGLTPTRREEFAESGQQVAQPVVEQVLRESVRDLPGVTFASGWSLDSLTESSEAVLVEAVGKDGTRRTIEARYVLGCDGGGSRTREAIGASLRGPVGAGTNLTVVFRAPGLARRVPHENAVHYWVFHPEVSGVLGRFDLQDTWWAGLNVGQAGSSYDVPAGLRRLVGGPVDCEIVCTDLWNARMQIADTFHTDRVFLVGDAAHLNPPWGGHGYNTGIGDAVNIGWKLAATLQGWAGPALPLSYGKERRDVAERVVAATTANMRAFLEMHAAFSGPAAGEEESGHRSRAKTVQHAMDAEFHSLGLVLGDDYGDSPVIVQDDRQDTEARTVDDVSTYVPSTRPGARLPHLWLPDGCSLYDTLGEGLTLLRLGENVGNLDTAPLADAARRRDVPLKIVDVDRPLVSPDDATSALLIRPDQHIAWRGEGTAQDSPGTVLDRVLAR